MCRRGLLLLGLCVCVLSGCLIGKPAPSTSWLPRAWSGSGNEFADLVVLDVFLCEATLGDTYIDDDLWKLADDQVVSLEHKALLEQNGFRVGQVGGVAPAGVQTLLTSKKSCPDPRRIQQCCGKQARIVLGPVVPRCNFDLHLEEPTAPADLQQAEFCLAVVPTAAPDGRTRLRFTPEVSYGQSAVAPTPTRDRTAWMFQKQQPTESYQALSWELTLAPNEHALIGGRFERLDTLGRQSFIRPEETPPRQRLLVIRAARPPSGMSADSIPSSADATSRRSPPLALQAAWTTFRGVSP